MITRFLSDWQQWDFATLESFDEAVCNCIPWRLTYRPWNCNDQPFDATTPDYAIPDMNATNSNMVDKRQMVSN